MKNQIFEAIINTTLANTGLTVTMKQHFIKVIHTAYLNNKINDKETYGLMNLVNDFIKTID